MPEPRSALAGAWHPGAHGQPSAETPPVTFSRRDGLAIVQVEADAGSAAGVARRLGEAMGVAVPEVPNTAHAVGAARLIWAGPWRWWAVAPARPALEAELAAALASSDAAVVDLSHARTVIRMTGHEARYVLAKGCGLNVHPRVFHADRVAQTGLFHAGVLIDCVDDRPDFDLYLPRSYALSVWQALGNAAAEYGYLVR